MNVNKRLTCFLLFVCNMALTLAAFYVMSLFELSKWVGVGIGGGLMILNAVAAFKFRGRAYSVVCFTVNSLAIGVALSSLYVYLGSFPKLWHTALAATGTALVYGAFCLLTLVPAVQSHPVVTGVLFPVPAIVAEVVCTVCVSLYAPVYALFMLLPLISFIIALSLSAEDFSGLVRNVAISSFSALAITVVVVLVVISQGDALDGIGDVFVPGGREASHKKKHDPYAFKTLEK